ncbi:hypothetical protein [Yersinia ruckeri]
MDLKIPYAELASKCHSLEKKLADENKSHINTIEQREYAQQSIDRLFNIVFGHNPEWSSAYNYQNAISDIDQQLYFERNQLKDITTESTTLLKKAARELSNSWIANSLQFNIEASLIYIRNHNIKAAQDILTCAIENFDPAFSENVDLNELDTFLDEQKNAFISYAEALERVKADVPATAKAIQQRNHEIQVQAVLAADQAKQIHSDTGGQHEN